jgi:pimeloyl-ACP methyl ester carboxylesterase
MKRTTFNPSAITTEDVDETTAWVGRPGGLHTLLSAYRAAPLDAEHNRSQFDPPLTIPVLAIGGAEYLGQEVPAQMRRVATDVRAVILPRCGHNPPLEQPQELAAAYLTFFQGR